MKNSMIKKGLLIFACLVLAVILLLLITEHPLRPLKIDTSVHSVEVFHEIEADSIDLLVLGSSHAWCGIDTGLLAKEYGISGYNYGCAWQHINTTKLFLEDALLTQKPKCVILETDVMGEPMTDTDMCGEIYYTKGVGNLKEKINYLSSCFGKNPGRYITYLFPTIIFHENWKSLKEESFLANSNETDFFTSCGYLGTESIEEVDLSQLESMEQADILPETMKYLDDIVDICNANNIKLIFCTVPFQGEISYGEAVKRYADENNLMYIDFMDRSLLDSLGIDEANDFRNAEHVNDTGARKVTEYIRQFL